MHIQSSSKISLQERLPSRNLLFCTTVITLGSAFQHGYYTACLNAPHDEFRAWTANYLRLHGATRWADNDMVVSLIWAIGTSLYFFGGAIGSIIAGYSIDRYDHTMVVMICLVSMAAPAVIMVAAYFTGINLFFMAARILLGVLAGIFSCVVPMYLVEIAPTNIRGMICCWYNVMYAIGVALAVGFGHPSFLGDNPWILIMSLPLVPIAIQVPLMLHLPVSPRYLLIKKRKYDEALKTLKWLRRTEELDALEHELDEMSTELEDYFMYRAVRDVNWSHLFKLKYLRKPILISMMMMCAQQICAINFFLLYSSKIFDDAGLSSYYGDIGTTVIGALFLGTSILSLGLIEIAGNKILFIYGYIGTFIFSFAHYMTFMYNKSRQECVGAVAALFVWFFVVHYVLGPHSVPWVIIPAMFNQASRPKAMAAAAFCNWTMNSVVAILYWPIVDIFHAQVLLFFLIPHMIFFILVVKYVPEVTGKTITQIREMYL